MVCLCVWCLCVFVCVCNCRISCMTFCVTGAAYPTSDGQYNSFNALQTQTILRKTRYSLSRPSPPQMTTTSYQGNYNYRLNNCNAMHTGNQLHPVTGETSQQINAIHRSGQYMSSFSKEPGQGITTDSKNYQHVQGITNPSNYCQQHQINTNQSNGYHQGQRIIYRSSNSQNVTNHGTSFRQDQIIEVNQRVLDPANSSMHRRPLVWRNERGCLSPPHGNRTVSSGLKPYDTGISLNRQADPRRQTRQTKNGNTRGSYGVAREDTPQVLDNRQSELQPNISPSCWKAGMGQSKRARLCSQTYSPKNGLIEPLSLSSHSPEVVQTQKECEPTVEEQQHYGVIDFSVSI